MSKCRMHKVDAVPCDATEIVSKLDLSGGTHDAQQEGKTSSTLKPPEQAEVGSW